MPEGAKSAREAGKKRGACEAEKRGGARQGKTLKVDKKSGKVKHRKTKIAINAREAQFGRPFGRRESLLVQDKPFILQEDRLRNLQIVSRETHGIKPPAQPHVSS